MGEFREKACRARPTALCLPLFEKGGERSGVPNPNFIFELESVCGISDDVSPLERRRLRPRGPRFRTAERQRLAGAVAAPNEVGFRESNHFSGGVGGQDDRFLHRAA